MEFLILAALGLVFALTVAVVVLKLLVTLVLIPFKLLGAILGGRCQARGGHRSSVRWSGRPRPAPRPRTRRHRRHCLGRRRRASLLRVLAFPAKLQDEGQPPERVFPAHDPSQNSAAHDRKTVIV